VDHRVNPGGDKMNRKNAATAIRYSRMGSSLDGAETRRHSGSGRHIHGPRTGHAGV
jgi:hypothetical protein